MLGELLEPARDGVGMRRLAVLPAEEAAAIVVVRSEVPALLRRLATGTR
jgi:hypothetical protein